LRFCEGDTEKAASFAAEQAQLSKVLSTLLICASCVCQMQVQVQMQQQQPSSVNCIAAYRKCHELA